MIISVSRRTDIPAFYGDWLMNRLREGYCTVPHPMKPRESFRVSLNSEDVDAFVFWTKYPKSLLPRLQEIESSGYPFIFLYTLTPYSSPLEKRLPPIENRLQMFKELAVRFGRERVIWRYDPIILSNQTDEAFHVSNFSKLASALKGHTQRVIISFLDYYGFVMRRLSELEKDNFIVYDRDTVAAQAPSLTAKLVKIAGANHMQIQSCAEELDLKETGVASGSCIDGALLQRLFNKPFPQKKDPGQRKKCLCTVSRDIGVYDTCGHQCAYCYAIRNPEVAEQRCKSHHPDTPSLI
jgi:DNA repair photolyase